jgi:hypothetical protein
MVAAPQRSKGGLSAILGGVQVDPTRLRRGLGDALMGIGAIGLGQDPFAVMQAQRQGRREEERTQIEDQRYDQDVARETTWRKEDQQAAAAQSAEDTRRWEAETAFEQETAQRKAEIDNLKLQMDMAKSDMERRKFAAELQFKQQELALKVQEGQRAERESAAKEEERKRAQSLTAAFGEWLGIVPPGSAAMVSGGGQSQQGMAPVLAGPQPAMATPGDQTAPQPASTGSPLDGLDPNQKKLIGAALVSGDTNGALKMANEALANKEKPLTEVQGNATMFYHRASQANDALEKMGYQPSRMQTNLDAIPGNLGKGFQSQEFQTFQVHANDLVRAFLRKESGATITPEEDAMARELWIPQPWDAPETLKAKAEARRNELEGMGVVAGHGIQKLPQEPAKPNALPSPQDVDQMSDEEVNQWLQKLQQQ